MNDKRLIEIQDNNNMLFEIRDTFNHEEAKYTTVVKCSSSPLMEIKSIRMFATVQLFKVYPMVTLPIWHEYFDVIITQEQGATAVENVKKHIQLITNNGTKKYNQAVISDTRSTEEKNN